MLRRSLAMKYMSGIRASHVIPRKLQPFAVFSRRMSYNGRIAFGSTEIAIEFIVSRGTLRTLLGSYLNRRPEELRFDYFGVWTSKPGGRSSGRGARL